MRWSTPSSVLATILATASISLASTIRVPSDQPTIQAGIDAAVDGDTVLVADGTYTGTGNRDIDFLGKAILLWAENGPENCIIDCEGSDSNPHRGLDFRHGEDSTSVVRGFTIRNGYADDAWPLGGGAISCYYSSPRIEGNMITGNRALRGGGVGMYSSDPIIEENSITLNSADYSGGGLYCYEYSLPQIRNNTIAGNSAGAGGGIYCRKYSSPSITANTISDNVAMSGGGIYLYEWSCPTIDGNEINGNTADGGDGGAIHFELFATATVTNNTIVGNSAELGGAIRIKTTSSPVIKGNDITGNLAYLHGGAINSLSGSPTIEDNDITMNSAISRGGAMYCHLGSPVISNNLIMGNSAEVDGGGIWWYESAVSVTGNTIRENRALRDGGGIYTLLVYTWIDQTISKNVISGNSAGNYGGGIDCHESSPTIAENIITGNSAGVYGGAIYSFEFSPPMTDNTIVGNSVNVAGGGLYCVFGSSPTIKNCIFWENSPEGIFVESGSPIVSYSDVQGGWTGEGNIDTDPMIEDPAGGDYRLMSDSPCIDSGDPESEVPPRGGDRVDMGAFEYEYPEYSPLRLTFENTPTIGARGETVVWDFTVGNLDSNAVVFDGWISVSGPNNSERDSVFGVTIPPRSVISGNVYLYIPFGAPLGLYTAKGRVGIMHVEIWDGEVFDGEVVEGHKSIIRTQDGDNWLMKIDLLGSNPSSE